MEEGMILKLCVVGQPGVGKTSLLQQYVHKKFDDKIRPTIGCDFSTKVNLGLDGRAVRLQLWDIAGQERYNAISKMYLRGALGCVIVCSAQDEQSLLQTIKWKKIISDNSDFDHSIPCILVQNKSDLIDQNEPSQHQLLSHLTTFSSTHEFCAAIQCSAKTNSNIELIFQTLLSKLSPIQILDRKKECYPMPKPLFPPSPNPNPNPLNLQKIPRPKINPNAAIDEYSFILLSYLFPIRNHLQSHFQHREQYKEQILQIKYA